MKILKELVLKNEEHLTRRHFFKAGGLGFGAMALSTMMGCLRSGGDPGLAETPFGIKLPPLDARVKSVIFLHMAGAPSQLELFDFKPKLAELDGQECPPSLLEGKRFAFIRGVPKMLGPTVKFRQHGQSGAWVSELFPHFSGIVDEVCFLKSVQTDEFNHAPAQLFMHTGSPQIGRPSFGSWVTYGLGSENQDLPGFVVLVSGNSAPSGGKSLWGSGFLPSLYQGVQFRSKGAPVLYAENPDGVGRDLRKAAIETISRLNQQEYEDIGDPEILTRIHQYEMAFKMQMTIPEATDISSEPEYIHDMYGTEPGANAFSNNCLLARRLVERGVRFVQLYHRGWDSHGSNEFESLDGGFLRRCQEVDQAMTALVRDLKQRGLLDQTLVVWGGEFGRTPMQENRGGTTNPFFGRDHHGEAFTMWLAGGGVKPGFTYGKTDDIGYFPVEGRVHVHDLQATLLRQMGLDHERLTYRFQGRDFRLTDVHGHIVKDILV